MATKKWEEGIDYSVEIEKAKAAGQDTSALEAARAAKIADLYGGAEPTLWGSDKTYSQAVKDNDNSAISTALNTYSKASSGGSSSNKYAGTDYHQEAINAAIAGDWDAVTEALNNREAKVGATGENYGKTSAQIYAELMELYGQKTPEVSANEYDSKYSTQIDQLLDSILNREEFSYDHTTDPSYLAYADQYKRLGDRAREDTLGNIAAMNGGYASSWAASAASQAQNDYNQQLSDIIPTLYDAAYNRYLNEDSMKKGDLNLLLGLDQTDYDRYRDTVSDSQWEKEFDYKVDRDEVADSQWEQQFDWNKTVDQWNMSNTEATQKFDQLMSKWQLTGVADAEVAAALGVPVGATTESYYFNKASMELNQAKLALDKASASKGSSSVDTTSQTFNGLVRIVKNMVDTSENYETAAEMMFGSDLGISSTDEYYAVGKAAGIPESVLNRVWDKYYMMPTEDDEPVGNRDKTYWKNAAFAADDPVTFLSNNMSQIMADGIDYASLLEDVMNLDALKK